MLPADLHIGPALQGPGPGVGAADDEVADPIRPPGRHEGHDPPVGVTAKDHVPQIQLLQKGQQIRGHVLVVELVHHVAVPVAPAVQGKTGETLAQDRHRLVEDGVVLPVAVEEHQGPSLPRLLIEEPYAVHESVHGLLLQKSRPEAAGSPEVNRPGP